MLQKAFTMIELIFVIIIIGILSIVMAPRLQTNNLQEAADQFLKHIRLTQSNALAQDFYLADSTMSIDYDNTMPNKQSKAQKYWFKRWWQIQVNAAGDSYTVFSDGPTTSGLATPNFNASPDANDNIAVDLETGLFISQEGTGVVEATRFLKVDLDDTYNVIITLGTNCISVSGAVESRAILFDNIGRPHCTKPDNTDLYTSLNPFDKLLTSQMIYTLTEQTSNDSIDICIEPESGYVHVCS